jgi:hypothetical protein
VTDSPETWTIIHEDGTSWPVNLTRFDAERVLSRGWIKVPTRQGMTVLSVTGSARRRELRLAVLG